MIDSKIHFFAIIKGVVLVALSLPLLLYSYKELVLFITEGANIFFVLMGFCGLFGVTFLIEGLLNFKGLSHFNEKLEERFLFFIKNKSLLINDETKVSFVFKKYLFLKVKWLLIEDERGEQIRFHNFQYKNFNVLKTTFEQKITEEMIQIKLSGVDRAVIIAFIAFTAWMIISAFFNIIF
jgi:hypothetical protein